MFKCHGAGRSGRRLDCVIVTWSPGRMNVRTWTWIALLAAAGGWIVWELAASPTAEASRTADGYSWSDDGRHILHQRLPSSEATETSTAEFVYDPVAREQLPSEFRRNGVRFNAPSVSMQPLEGESTHTADGLKGASSKTKHGGTRAEGPSGEITDPRLSFAGRAQPDRSTEKEGRLDYGAVFDPSVVPFKRNHALNKIAADYELSVERGKLRELQVVGNQVDAGREIFWGSVLLEGDGEQLIPLPSISPDSRILSYQVTPPTGLTFHQDAADNFYVKSDTAGIFRVVFVMDAGSGYFGRSLPSTIRVGRTGGPPIPALPANVERSARRFNRTLGLRPSTSYENAMNTLVAYFRSFKPGEPPPSRGDIFTDLAAGKKGICRHRSFAFTVAALQLGVPTRYVVNEAHIFVEIWIPGPNPGWMRIDLGGGADELVVHNSTDKQKHRTTRSDPFGGLDASQHTPMSLAGADTVSGLPDDAPEAVTESDRNRGAEETSKLAESLSRLIKRPEKRPNSRPTQTVLRLDSAIVFRGDRVEANGQVIAIEGSMLPSGIVQILLVSPESGRAIRQLATATLDPRGAFRTVIAFPREMSPGNYEIVAEFMGTETLAPSTSD